MTGAILATLAQNTPTSGGGGGGGPAPNAMTWSNIYGTAGGATSTLTVAGVVAGPATITMSRTGGLGIGVGYLLNGAFNNYTGGFTVTNGDTLGWVMQSAHTTTVSGTVTIKSAGGTVTVGTFTFLLVGSSF